MGKENKKPLHTQKNLSIWKTNETKKQGNLNKLKLKLKQDIIFTVKIAKIFLKL